MEDGEFEMQDSKMNDPTAELQGIESVIPARPVGATLSKDSYRESFCIEEGFPASGNDNLTNELLRPEAELRGIIWV
jgi:hypothetical protein